MIAKPGTIAQGATPIVLTWDYLAFGYKDSFAGNPTVEITYPSPTIASMYVQAISAYAPHPNCAKLWMEILHSDEGQLAWMKGYAHGVQQADMEARGVIPGSGIKTAFLQCDSHPRLPRIRTNSQPPRRLSLKAG